MISPATAFCKKPWFRRGVEGAVASCASEASPREISCENRSGFLDRFVLCVKLIL